jgi:hypothetical protein
MRDALAVYYFPGMWDWERSIVLPLVRTALRDSFERQRVAGAPVDPARAAEAGALLERYVEWAPEVDGYSPLRVEAEFEVDVLVTGSAEVGLVADDGSPIRYAGRVDAVVTDRSDAPWLVQHRVVSGEPPADADLLRDEELLAACWAWEQFYQGMEVAGTVHNELRIGVAEVEGASGPSGEGHRGLPQHEPSGGGRSFPHHRRVGAREGAGDVERMRRVEAGPFRRTAIARSRAEIRAAGARLAVEAAEMADPDVRIYPSPSPEHCPSCPFVDPCLVMFEGRDPVEVLAAGYRSRGPDVPVPGRLGGMAWSLGRGATVPRRPRG